jgi:hypothetical protein
VANGDVTDTAADYTMVLLQPVRHHTDELADDEENNTTPFDVTVRVEDDDGSFNTNVFSVAINDDTPVEGSFAALSVTYNPLNPPAQGDPSLIDGDTNSGFKSGADGWGSIEINGPEGGDDPGTEFDYDQIDNTLYGSRDGLDIFALTVNGDGTYSFELLEPTAGADKTQDFGATPDAGSPTTGLDFGDWFVTAEPGFDNTEVNPSTAGLSGDGNDFKVGEALRFSYDETIDPTDGDPDQLVFGLKAPQGATFDVYFYSGADPVGSSLSQTGDEANGLVLDLSLINAFDSVVLEPTSAPSALKIESISTVDLYAPQDETITFSVTATDGDGDTIDADIMVTVDQEIPPAAVTGPVQQVQSLSEPAQETVMEDGESLLATDGDDVFAFALSDAGAAPADVTISGFGDSGTDSLDLRDLLTGEEASDDLSSYLNVRLDGADTVIEVSSSGSFKGNPSDAGAIDQTITLEGVDLVGDMSDVNLVIQSMLDSGKLTIDS